MNIHMDTFIKSDRHRCPASKVIELVEMTVSAADNAFMYSVIESCKHNDIDPGKYISFLLGKLKTAGDGDSLMDSCRATAGCKP